MALFNGGYPASYPYIQQPMIPQPQPQYQQQSGITWVQGEAGAKSYMVAPNTTVQLWDSEQQVIYLKSADASGMPSIKTLDYTIRDMAQPVLKQQEVTYATASDLEAIKADLSELRKKVEEIYE